MVFSSLFCFDLFFLSFISYILPSDVSTLLLYCMCLGLYLSVLLCTLLYFSSIFMEFMGFRNESIIYPTITIVYDCYTMPKYVRYSCVIWYALRDYLVLCRIYEYIGFNRNTSVSGHSSRFQITMARFQLFRRLCQFTNLPRFLKLFYVEKNERKTKL